MSSAKYQQLMVRQMMTLKSMPGNLTQGQFQVQNQAMTQGEQEMYHELEQA